MAQTNELADIYNELTGSTPSSNQVVTAIRSAFSGEVAVVNHLAGSGVAFLAAWLASHYGFHVTAGVQNMAIAIVVAGWNALFAFITRQKVIPVAKVEKAFNAIKAQVQPTRDRPLVAVRQAVPAAPMAPTPAPQPAAPQDDPEAPAEAPAATEAPATDSEVPAPEAPVPSDAPLSVVPSADGVAPVQ